MHLRSARPHNLFIFIPFLFICVSIYLVIASVFSVVSHFNAQAAAQRFYTAEHVVLHPSEEQFPHWTPRHDTPVSRTIDFRPEKQASSGDSYW